METRWARRIFILIFGELCAGVHWPLVLTEIIWSTGVGFGGGLALRPHPRPFGHPLPMNGEGETGRILASPQRELGGDWR